MARSASGESVLTRMVRIFEAFTPDETVLSVTQVARRARLHPATASRLVAELEAHGLLAREPDRRVRVGVRLWELALRASPALGLRETAMPFMEDAHAVLGHHVQLGVLDGTDVLFVERLSAPGAVINYTRIAGRLPLHVSSSGLVLLAFGGRELQEQVLAMPLTRYTAHTLISPAALRAVLVTSMVTGLWWFVGVAVATFPLRNTPGSMRPGIMSVGSAQSHLYVSLGLLSPDEHVAFAITLGLLLLCTLPLVTRACVAAQAGLGQVLLSDMSALYRRIRGLEQERDTARAQAVAAVTAEAAALRRLERDIHDGPQQRLVRLAMELGRAQHNFDSRPEAVRAALADAIVQTQEALDELRVLSRGIAPPILVDRGLREALTALAARSTIPVEFDAAPLDRRLDAAVETAAYFVVAEALTNVAKHSRARRCVVGLRHGEETLRAWVTDDGMGGAALGKGHGLQGLDDRVHAAGGRLLVTSPGGGPTTITAELPCC